MGDLGEPVGECRGRDRRDRIEARVRQVEVAERPAGAEADGEADGEAECELDDEQPDHVGGAVVGHLDPFDEPGDEQQGDSGR